jgi:hypothetical protein
MIAAEHVRQQEAAERRVRPLAASHSEPTVSEHPVHRLQRSIGNQETMALLRDTGMAPDEREDLAPGAPAPQIVYDVLREPATPLDADVRSFMELRVGAPLDRVLLHTSPRAQRSAAAVAARAYTVGQHIVFGAPGFDRNDPRSLATLAHELTHTVQNSAAAWGGETLELDSPHTEMERAAREAGAAVEVGLGERATRVNSQERGPEGATLVSRQPAAPSTGLPPGPRRDLQAVFARALQDKFSALAFAKQVKFVYLVDAEPFVLLRLLVDGPVTLAPDERPQARAAFDQARRAFVQRESDAIERELTADPVKGIQLWATLLDEFKTNLDLLNHAPFAGMKDRVENALLRGYEAKAAHGPGAKPPPERVATVELLRSELRDLRHEMVEAYELGIATWRIPEQAGFDEVSLAAGAGTAASGAGSVLTAVPGVVGMEAAAGAGLALGTLGIGLIVLGTAAAIYAIWKQAEAAKEENRRQIIEAGVKSTLVDTVARVFDRLQEHEDFLVVQLAIAADKEGFTLTIARPTWRAFVWRKMAPDFPTSLEAGKDFIARRMRESFDKAFKSD